MSRDHSIITVALMLSAIVNVNAELTLKPEVSTRAWHDDNPRLLIRSPTEVTATVNDVGIESIYSAPTYSLSLTPRVRLSRYTEETELDSEDYFVSTNMLKSYERHQLAGEFKYAREATFSTEQTNLDIFNINIPETTFSFNTSWLYTVNGRLNLSVYANFLDVSFEKNPRSNFVDYLQYGSGTALNYAASERTTWIFSLFASQFKTPQTGTETVSYGLQIGFDHQFDETLDASFRIGQNRSEQEFKMPQTQIISVVPLRFATTVADETERSAGEIIDLDVEKRFERATARLLWSRAFSPSSQGVRQESEEVDGIVKYRMTPFLDAVIRVSYRRRNQEGEVSARRLNDIKVINVNGRLEYRFSPLWKAEIGARYRELDRLDTGLKSDSKLIYLNLRYRPREITLFR